VPLPRSHPVRNRRFLVCGSGGGEIHRGLRLIRGTQRPLSRIAKVINVAQSWLRQSLRERGSARQSCTQFGEDTRNDPLITLHERGRIVIDNIRYLVNKCGHLVAMFVFLLLENFTDPRTTLPLQTACIQTRDSLPTGSLFRRALRGQGITGSRTGVSVPSN
jgi:hypothetical protein